MPGLVQSAAAIMGSAERRLETTASNIANLATPGFKRQLTFSEIGLANPAGSLPEPAELGRADLSQGRMTETGGPFDFAVAGAGFFRLRAGEAFVYSRQGNFRRGNDGTLVSPQGYVLQQADGGDLTLDVGDVQIGNDGTVVQKGRPIGRIAVYAPLEGRDLLPLSGSIFTIRNEATAEVAGSQVRQGMTEASNVSLADEMVTMMGALREAERGARLIQLYDDLIGRAVTAFGQGPR